MIKHMTHSQAWEDFWEAKHDLPTWQAMNRKQKTPAYMANKAHKAGALTTSRAEALLRRYAPDRYDFKLIITLK